MHATAQESNPIPLPSCLPSAGVPKPPLIHDFPDITRLAVFGGSYGNVPALRACLDHARAQGCDGFAFIGDATGCCGHSDEVIALIRENCPILVAGNYEQKAAAGQEDCGCNYTNDEDNHYGGIAHLWAMRTLSEENRAWLGTWPDLALVKSARGTILLCHGSPGQTNEFLYESELDDTRLEAWLDAFGAVGFVCTHSGFPWIRRLPGGRFAVNCGVSGKPDHDHDAAVHYATIALPPTPPCPASTPSAPTAENAPAAAQLNIERVEYDHLAWADQLDSEGVDDVFTIPVRNGVWTCGLLSMPSTERILRPRPSGWLQALRSVTSS
jgi:diadenosine tetraphosphatase ApaH/serine/threonine PP2A family protein phosphatase